jgi:hypothetical protein
VVTASDSTVAGTSGHPRATAAKVWCHLGTTTLNTTPIEYEAIMTTQVALAA